MPAPSAHDLAALGDDVGLGAAWNWWAARQPAAARVVVSQVAPATHPWWRSRRIVWTILVVSALASAWVVRAQVWSRATLSEETGSVEPLWSTVSATDLAQANAVLLRLGQTEASISAPLSATEVAALAFRSALRRQPPTVANLEARIDSMISIRGTLVDPTRHFELRGHMRVVRPRLAQIDVVEMQVIDAVTGRRVPPASNAATGFPPIRFSVPSYVEAIRLVDRQALVVKRVR